MSAVQEDTPLTEDDRRKIWDQELARASGEAITFDDVVVDEPPAGDAPGEPVVEDVRPQPDPEPEPDETSAATEVPKEDVSLNSIQEQLAQLETLNRRIRNTEGRIGSLNSNFETMAREVKESIAASRDVKNAPTQEQIEQAAQTPVHWEALKHGYDDWAKAIDERIQMIPSSPNIDVDKLRQDVRDELSAEFEMRLVDVAHRGWREDVNTPEYANWIANADPHMEQLAESSRAEDAIELLNAFKADTRRVEAPAPSARELEAERQQRLKDASTVPTGTGSTGPRRKAVEDMTDEEYWYHSAQRLKETR